MVKLKKAIFLDRDGTIIKTNLSKKNTPIAIKSIKELKILPNVKKILNKLKNKYLIFIITNQPDVEKKKNSKKNVEQINNYLSKKLPINKIYTCYCASNKCKYRKPKAGMIFKAVKEYNIDLKKSFVIGDRWKDINAGYLSKCKTIFINNKYNEMLKKKPDYVVDKFRDILEIFKY